MLSEILIFIGIKVNSGSLYGVWLNLNHFNTNSVFHIVDKTTLSGTVFSLFFARQTQVVFFFAIFFNQKKSYPQLSMKEIYCRPGKNPQL